MKLILLFSIIASAVITSYPPELVNVVALNYSGIHVADVHGTNMLVSSPNFGNSQGIAYVQDFLTNQTSWLKIGDNLMEFYCDLISGSYLRCFNGSAHGLIFAPNDTFTMLKSPATAYSERYHSIDGNYLLVGSYQFSLYQVTTGNYLWNASRVNSECNCSAYQYPDSVAWANRGVLFYKGTTNNSLEVRRLSTGAKLYTITGLFYNIQSFNIGGFKTSPTENSVPYIAYVYVEVINQYPVYKFDVFNGTSGSKMYTQTIEGTYVTITNNAKATRIQITDKYVVYITEIDAGTDTFLELHGHHLLNGSIAFKYDLTSFGTSFFDYYEIWGDNVVINIGDTVYVLSLSAIAQKGVATTTSTTSTAATTTASYASITTAAAASTTTTAAASTTTTAAASTTTTAAASTTTGAVVSTTTGAAASTTTGAAASTTTGAAASTTTGAAASTTTGAVVSTTTGAAASTTTTTAASTSTTTGIAASTITGNTGMTTTSTPQDSVSSAAELSSVSFSFFS